MHLFVLGVRHSLTYQHPEQSHLELLGTFSLIDYVLVVGVDEDVPYMR